MTTLGVVVMDTSVVSSIANAVAALVCDIRTNATCANDSTRAVSVSTSVGIWLAAFRARQHCQ